MMLLEKYQGFWWFIFIVFNWAALFQSGDCLQCDGSREIRTNASGVISDGEGAYLKNTRCQWLIKAPSVQHTITLSFTIFALECSYDFLYIYDGESFHAPLLASLSGNILPNDIISTGPSMLVFLFSDNNYVLEGFQLSYATHMCPNNCSGIGLCEMGICVCPPHYQGKACEEPWCPNDCSSLLGKGFCNMTSKKCDCNTNFYGESCSISTLYNHHANSWFTISGFSVDIPPRASHAMAYYSTSDSLWVFGGLGSNVVMGDLWRFIFKSNNWQQVTTSHRPAPRFQHTLTCSGHNLYLFGGELSNSSLTNELWMFNLQTSSWRLVNDSSLHQPSRRASHSATLVGSKIYFFGGRTEEHQFSADIYAFDTSTETWEKVPVKYNYLLFNSRSGHSAVYHDKSNSLVVFGGLHQLFHSTSVKLDTVMSFSLTTLAWDNWNVNIPNKPQPLAYHSAVVMGDCMVVYGGLAHVHQQYETCYGPALHFLSLSCRTWVPASVLSILSPQQNQPPAIGRFGHACTLKDDQTLVLFGGFQGRSLNDMLIYLAPSTVISKDASGNPHNSLHCYQYIQRNVCLQDPSCGWCSDDMKCYSLQKANPCGSTLDSWVCSDACIAHTKCESCLLSGGHCAWCSSTRQCRSNATTAAACPSGGTWMAGVMILETIAACQTQEQRTGLTYINYLLPENLNYPDGVSFLGDAHYTIGAKYVHTQGYRQRSVANGYVHPVVKMTVAQAEAARVWLHATDGSSQLQLSPTTDPLSKALVANLVGASSTSAAEAVRPDGTLLFPQLTQGSSYYIEVATTLHPTEAATMIVRWKYTGTTPTEEAIPASVLQPYASGSCVGHVTCMKCVSDYSCGWCPTASACLLRTEPCPDSYLTRYPEQCQVCSDYVNCRSCAEATECSWDSIVLRCYRSGLRHLAIALPASCSPSCSERLSCGSCVVDNECTWCSQIRQCFPFSLYISSYVFGQCSTWLDRSSLTKQQCPVCSTHTTCDRCLADHGCGWCADAANPLNGRCTDGDWSGPDPSSPQCSTLVTTNSSVTWSYVRCPDVNECQLGLHNCTGNSTCHNVDGSFLCPCNSGFVGDGKTSCVRTCHPLCVHGVCNATDYTCSCDMGWVGSNCSTDCGCHGHSTCRSGVGLCDQCYSNTQGPTCERCTLGTFGNATSDVGCSPCQCNGHGNETLNFCDTTTGKCYCSQHTVGNTCQRCAPGLAGNAVNGGTCYLPCRPRYIDAANVTSGYISSAVGSGSATAEATSCLWVISTAGNGSRNLIYGDIQNSINNVPISLVVLRMDVPCAYNHIHVYDGVPRSPDVPETQDTYKLNHIGSYCGHGWSPRHTVVAHSGTITVHFVGNQTSDGHFVAYYQTRGCVRGCRGHSACLLLDGHHQCVCHAGWTGIGCDLRECPLNCSEAQGRGNCDHARGSCICLSGFSGISCNQTTAEGLIATLLNAYNSSSPTQGMPSGLFGHTLSHTNDNLYFFGGHSVLAGVSSALWTWHVPSGTWSETVPNSMDRPPGRYLHCAVVYQNSVVVFGGMGKDNAMRNDVWQFNIASSSWNQIQFHGSTLPSLMGHTCTLFGTKMYVVGGYSFNEGMEEDTLELDLSALSLRWMKPTGFGPAGVFGHSAVRWQDSILIYGGIAFYLDGIHQSDRLYALNTATNTWQFLDSIVSNKPPSLFLHVAEMHGNEMYIMGGYGDVGRTGFNGNIYVWNAVCDQLTTIRPGDVSGLQEDALFTSMGLASALHNGVMYVSSGFHGDYPSLLISLALPASLCATARRQSDCLQVRGCNWCFNVNTTDGQCYGMTAPVPQSCQPITVPGAIVSGQACDQSAITQRQCGTYSSCVSCLATYPHQSSSHCKWCRCRNTAPVCVPSTSACPSCHAEFTAVGQCSENKCEAASCGYCGGSGKCIWTRHFFYHSEMSRNFAPQPIYPWNCFLATLEAQVDSNITDKSPPAQCPSKCVNARSCGACLSSPGSEGGTNDCVWSDGMEQCLSRSVVLALCPAVGCGRLYTGQPRSCPVDCSTHVTCSSCLQQQECGWCAAQGSMGRGVCYKGSLKGPRQGNCGYSLIDPGQPTVISANTNTSLYGNGTLPPVWASVMCPLENECLNNRHNCSDLQDCVDTDDGFTCPCKPGYQQDNETAVCRPICVGGCANGICVRPDECQCNFGWTGTNCTMSCRCHGNSNCPNATHRDVCLQCHNNTQGPTCGECSPMFVGDPSDRVPCQPCYEVCNRETNICVSQSDATAMRNRSVSEILAAVSRGVTTSGDAVCVNCGNASAGRLCETCLDGYFMNDGKCMLCNCNGHAFVCNKVNGTGCQCQDNTVSDHDCDAMNCWEKQCSKCDQTYIGNPVDGQQCYKRLSQMEQILIAMDTGQPLPRGRASFHTISPKYTNVPIQLIVDVHAGAIDVFISLVETSLVVVTNYTTGEKNVDVRAPNRVVRSVSTAWSVITADPGRLSTFVTYNGGLLRVIGVTRRLIITSLDKDLHFGQEKFFVAFVSVGLTTTNLSHGIASFRQENAQIDLFVFFSVFLSIFFLILSNFVIGWKLKQVFHRRRRAHIQQVELETMASRPYSSYTFLCDRNESIVQHGATRSRMLLPKASDAVISGHENNSAKVGGSEALYPLAVQQTDDGQAAVATVVVQLPENELSPWNVALGSCLSLCNSQQLLLHPANANGHHSQRTKLQRRYVSTSA